MAKVLYIAGYGRSGSTVLDIVLGNHPEIASVGEVTNLLSVWSERLCSCGAPYGKCEFWKDLFLGQAPPPELDQLNRKLEKVSFIPRLLLGLISNDDRQAYRALQTGMFDYVLARSGKQIIVDSSKSCRPVAGRFLALSILAGHDVYVLHLVRNGLATMESDLIIGDNLALEGYAPTPKWQAVRTPLGWVGTNVLVPMLGRVLDHDHYMLLRYEDFIADPVSALHAIGKFCGFNSRILTERINRDDFFVVGHNVSGNRVRLQGKITLWKGIKQDYGADLKLYQRLLFNCVGKWLHRCYGYR